MSRSYRRTRIFGNTYFKYSEKQDKRDANRKFRRIIRQFIIGRKDVLPQLRELSNIWTFSKDGKSIGKILM